MIIDGERVTGRTAAIIRELMRRRERVEERNVTRVTAYMSARGRVLLGIEARFIQPGPEEIVVEPVASELA